jgi:hypothetical protein
MRSLRTGRSGLPTTYSHLRPEPRLLPGRCVRARCLGNLRTVRSEHPRRRFSSEVMQMFVRLTILQLPSPAGRRSSHFFLSADNFLRSVLHDAKASERLRLVRSESQREAASGRCTGTKQNHNAFCYESFTRPGHFKRLRGATDFVFGFAYHIRGSACVLSDAFK